jgi:hypothetical protein
MPVVDLVVQTCPRPCMQQVMAEVALELLQLLLPLGQQTQAAVVVGQTLVALVVQVL